MCANTQSYTLHHSILNNALHTLRLGAGDLKLSCEGLRRFNITGLYSCSLTICLGICGSISISIACSISIGIARSISITLSFSIRCRKDIDSRNNLSLSGDTLQGL